MTSEAQVQANRLNAQKSTGPRTEAGRAVVSQNALRHGLFSQEEVVSWEKPEEFAEYREVVLAELEPAGAIETILAERLVGLGPRS